MALARERMIDRMLASDSAYNGRFLTGVLTTGIYCLPSCRARKPKPDNVRFFDNPEEARQAGLRPCKRCRPDDFYRRRDPDREAVEALVERLRREPADFAGVEDVESASGMGSSKLHEMFRRHFHSTPAQVLTRARVEAAQRLLLETDLSIAAVAFEVGFEGLSTFNENFRRLAALSPQEYRRLLGATSFRIALPPDYPLGLMLGYLGRDNDSSTIQVEGRRVTAGMRLGGAPALLKAELASGAARASLETRGPLPADAAARAHGQLLRLLGLTRDPAAFEKRMAAAPETAPLIAGRRGLRIPQTPDAFDGLTWVIIGQQITLSFAFTLRRRLVERTGTAAGGGLFTPPAVEAVAGLEVEDLLKEQYSRRKAEYLIGAARQVASGELPLDRLAASSSATRAEAELLAVRGLGPWSVHYLLMRAFGFEDCVPVGDAGLVRGLAKFFRLPERPGAEETQELMRPFAPYRSWATFHLWQSLKDESI